MPYALEKSGIILPLPKPRNGSIKRPAFIRMRGYKAALVVSVIVVILIVVGIDESRGAAQHVGTDVSWTDRLT